MNTGRKDRRQCQFWPSFLAPIYYSVPLKDRRCRQFWPGWVHSNLHTPQTRTNFIKAHRVHKRLLSALSLRCLAMLNFGKRNCHPEHNVLNTCKTMEKNKGTPSMHRGISKTERGNRYLWRWEGHRCYQDMAQTDGLYAAWREPTDRCWRLLICPWHGTLPPTIEIPHMS